MTNPANPTAADPRPLLFAAAAQAVRLVEALQADIDAGPGTSGPGASVSVLDAPTPCTEYGVRDLAGHVLAVLRRIEHVATGGNPLDVPQEVRGVADAGWAATAQADAGTMKATWSDDAVLDRMLTLPWATLPGRAAALAYTQELTVHAWDLAAAIGRVSELDDSLAVAVLPLARQFVPADQRGGHVPFGPVVELASRDLGSAGPYDELVAWLGRDPAWRP